MLTRLSFEGQSALMAAMAATDAVAATVADLFEALHAPNSVAGAVLAESGRDVRPASTQRRVTPGKTLTPQLKSVLQRAAQVADESQYDVVTTGHLLIAISESDECPVPLHLSSRGELSSTPETVRKHARVSRATFRLQPTAESARASHGGTSERAPA